MDDSVKRACEHCGTIERALTIWPRTIHDTCGCACHNQYTTKYLEQSKAKKRKKK